jgi:acyl-CoA synthetase (AMP-forming)/AMP-acid ligase II
MYQMTQPLRSAAASTPGRLATVCDDRSTTWLELRDRTAVLADAIRRLGVSSGDRTAVLALNSDRYLQYLYASWWAGSVVVPMNTRWSASEHAYSLNDSQAKVLFIDATFAPLADEIRAEIGHELTLVYIGDEEIPNGMLAFDALLESGTQMPDECAHRDALAGIYYTGGTTGFPKGVMLSHEALWYNGLAVAKHAHFEFGDRYLHVAPMFHLADAAGSMGATMTGATHYFVSGFVPDQVMRSIAVHSITHTLIVPTMIGMLMQHPDFSAEHFRDLKYLIYGASPMPEGLLRHVIDVLPHVGLVQGYGQTEMAPLVTTLSPGRHVVDGPNAGKLRSAGQVICGCEVEIRDDACRVLPHGEVGELYARSPGSMRGYWQLPELTAETLQDGWVKSGDLAYIDHDGFVFIVDRAKDMIVTGGENVFSAEVESIVSTHPAVATVAVIGVPDDTWGEAVHAIVVPVEAAEVTENEIIDYCRDKLASYKCPKSVSIREEPLPLSGAGKVLKRELREPYWGGKKRQIS